MSLGGGFGDFEDDEDADDNGSSYSFDGFENERDDDGNDDGGFNEDFSDQQQKRWYIYWCLRQLKVCCSVKWFVNMKSHFWTCCTIPLALVLTK